MRGKAIQSYGMISNDEVIGMRVDPNYITNLAAALNSSQTAVQNLTQELSSGVRVNSVGEDPIAAGQNVMLLNQIRQDDSFSQSANLVTGKLQVADSALGSIVSQLTQAISLATSADNGTMSVSDVQAIAKQIAGIRDEVTTLANTSYQGQYVFAGTQSGSAPFSTSTATSPAITSYGGDSNVTYLSMPNGQRIQLNVPGDQIFQGPGANDVFAALNNLIADYSSGTVNQTQAANDTQALTSALNYVSQQRVSIDKSITSLSAASDAVTNEKTQLTVAQTNLMQADVAQVATHLSLAETQQTALEAVIAQLGSVSNSLFSKL
jgi:flagellar hook-associated protein 3 FlgL